MERDIDLETKKMVLDLQIHVVRVKENLSWATAGPAKDKHQAPTNCFFFFIKFYARAIIPSCKPLFPYRQVFKAV